MCTCGKIPVHQIPDSNLFRRFILTLSQKEAWSAGMGHYVQDEYIILITKYSAYMLLADYTLFWNTFLAFYNHEYGGAYCSCRRVLFDLKRFYLFLVELPDNIFLWPSQVAYVLTRERPIFVLVLVYLNNLFRCCYIGFRLRNIPYYVLVNRFIKYQLH